MSLGLVGVLFLVGGPGFSGDLTDDEGVGKNDDYEGKQVQGSHIEEVVGQLIALIRKEVEGRTLFEPCHGWVCLLMKDHTLEQKQQKLS